MKTKTTIYLHSNTDSMWAAGRRLKLGNEALKRFVYSVMQVEVTLDVDTETGASTIASVAGQKITGGHGQ